MTSVQAESVRGLGAFHGGLYALPSYTDFVTIYLSTLYTFFPLGYMTKRVTVANADSQVYGSK